MKITTFSMLSIASLALLFSACGNAADTTANNSTTNTASKSNTAVVANAKQPAVNNTSPVSNTAPNTAGKSEGDKIQGELQVGKSESVILYVGKESGDYAGYCFTNDSEAGRAILAACKDRAQCEVTVKVDYEGGCKVPGLEADLSASGRIMKVESAKSLGSRK
jgi:protein involved in sex pheromone biosynthesis